MGGASETVAFWTESAELVPPLLQDLAVVDLEPLEEEEEWFL